MLDLSFPDLLDLSLAHLVVQTEIQTKIRDALNEQLDSKVGLGGMPTDSFPVDSNGLPTISPLNAPMVVNNRTIAEMDEMLDFLKSSSKDRETSVDPILGGEV